MQKPFREFVLERYFDKYEFTAPYLLCCSDCEPVNLPKMLELLSKLPKEQQKIYTELNLGYGDYNGETFLREAVQAHYNNPEYNFHITYRREIKLEDICVMVPAEAITHFMNSFLSTGDEVVCVAPAYQSLFEVAHSKNCKLKMWNFRVENNEPKFLLEDLKELITKNTKLLIINFPHNPTGFLPTFEEMMEIINLCKQNDVTIFSDEITLIKDNCDGNFNYPSVCQLYENSVVLSGVSKTVGLAGLRIGWLVANNTLNPDVLKGVSHLKDFTSICPSKPSQALAYLGMLDGNFKLLRDENKRIIKENLKVLKEFCQRTGLFEYYEPRGGSTVFVKLNADDVDGFCHKSATEWGVVLLPGSTYIHDKQQVNNRVRLGLGRNTFQEGLKVLEAEYMKKK
eukprot:snap_masked-scaffold_4-processed-gene-7.32-mRNA-1 protein AED:1.00 eAED:1.00 QI:0/0/0/0/1/1/2/0/397